MNRAIRENLPVEPRFVPYARALQEGAIALFGEKYGAEVRMMDIRGEHEHVVSRELCGGTHVHRTGDIGMFVILSEASIGAGMRRIEALAGPRGGMAAPATFSLSGRQVLEPRQWSCPNVAALQEEAANLRKRIESIESQRSRDQAAALVSRVRGVDGVRYLAEVVGRPTWKRSRQWATR
jgi:alanyl-tRNA synthetase